MAVSLRPGFFRRQRLCRRYPCHPCCYPCHPCHPCCYPCCHPCCFLLLSQRPFRFAAASLKAVDNLPQVHGQGGGDKEDAVQVVGHHLEGRHLYLRVMTVNGPPLAFHRHAQLRQLDARLAPAVRRSKGIAGERAEEGPAAFHLHGDHIQAPTRVVVMVVAAVHRGFLLAGIFLFLRDFLVSKHFSLQKG